MIRWLLLHSNDRFFKGMQRNLHVKGKRWFDRSLQKTFLASPQRQASLTGVLRNSYATSPYQKSKIFVRLYRDANRSRWYKLCTNPCQVEQCHDR